ncbi:MAG TPA: ABC transporter substrate-binding protein, partial [Pseudomonadales bacterium]|nr:ABC transporter substrate-binding protein [Pseudomonadales bacterium]
MRGFPWGKLFSSFFIFCLFFSSQAEARTYRIGMIAWIAYSPLNVADTQGLWKKLGVDVEVINFGSNQELNSALQNKRIDIALDMMGSWVGMQQSGVPLTILGETDWSYGGDKIISKKGVDLTTLKGQSIGVYLNQPSVTYFLSKFLEQQKLKLSDVNIVELEPEAMADNFIAGRFNVIVNYDPQALRAINNGNGVVAATSASWDGVIPEGFVAHSENYKTMDRQDLVKIFKGWMQAVAWSKDPANWETYKTIINDKTFPVDPPFSDKEIQDMLASVRIHDHDKAIATNKNGGELQT